MFNNQWKNKQIMRRWCVLCENCVFACVCFESCSWSAIYDNVYDLTGYVPNHRRGGHTAPKKDEKESDTAAATAASLAEPKCGYGCKNLKSLYSA